MGPPRRGEEGETEARRPTPTSSPPSRVPQATFLERGGSRDGSWPRTLDSERNEGKVPAKGDGDGGGDSRVTSFAV